MEAIAGLFMVILFFCVWAGAFFGIPAIIALLVQYAVNGIWHQNLPFWPVYAGVFVVSLLFGGFRINIKR